MAYKVPVIDLVKDRMENYLKAVGRPEQVIGCRDGQVHVAKLAETSAGC